MSAIQQLDIAIVGAGITGLSAAYHLQKSGLKKIGLFADQMSQSEHAAGMISGGLIDNFTRVSQRHGSARAKDVWNFSLDAFKQLRSFAKDHGIPLQEGLRLRLIENHDEDVEAAQAVEELKAQGFQSRLYSGITAACTGRGSSAHLMSVQDDEVPSGIISVPLLLQALKKDNPIPLRPKVDSLVVKSDFVELVSGGETIQAEIVILANHLHIRDFLPQFHDVLVSSQDQWHSFELSGAPLPFTPGTLLTWTHGHMWALVEDTHHIRIGGARFMRPMAGFEANEANLNEKVQNFLKQNWSILFPQHPVQEVLVSKAGLDIRPCDELPVIGPMFGESRILIAGGFMGQGLTLGFAAGRALSDLVMGKQTTLPRSLWPERHRSLPSDDE